jgi:hypothetical protein
MRSKILVVLSAVAILAVGVSSTAMARGSGGGVGWSHGGMSMHGHGQFNRRFHFVNRFNKNLFNRFNGNPFLLGDWGWDWGLGGYGNSGYGNTTVVAFPQATPAAVTSSISTGPCQWKSQTFSVPSSEGGKRPVEVLSCGR